MAPKRLNPMEEPPAAFSDEDEEEEHSSSADVRETDADDSSSGEEDDSPPIQKKTTPPPDPKTLALTSDHPKSSDDEDSDDGESDTDSDAPPPPSVNVKPIATKAMEKEAPNSKPSSKSISSKPAPLAAKPGSSKRPATAPEEEKREVKRGKKEDGLKETVKKTPFQRLWRENDEIVILKGMLDFIKMRGVDPSAQSDEFHEFIKKSFQFDFSKNQLFEKIKRVRKKYKDNLKNGKKGTKPHEQGAFDLCEKLWGNGGVVLGLESTTLSNGKARKSQNLKVNKADPVPSVDGGNIQSKVMENVTELVPAKGLSNPSLLDEMAGELGGFEASILQRAKGVIDVSKKAELERKSRKLKIAELELYLEKKALVGEQAKLLLSHYKSLDK